MKQQITPKTAAIIFACVVVVVLGIAYKLFFTQATVEPPKLKKGEEYKMRPTGGEAYQMQQQGLSMPSGVRTR